MKIQHFNLKKGFLQITSTISLIVNCFREEGRRVQEDAGSVRSYRGYGATADREPVWRTEIQVRFKGTVHNHLSLTRKETHVELKGVFAYLVDRNPSRIKWIEEVSLKGLFTILEDRNKGRIN